MTNELGTTFNDIQEQIREKQIALLCLSGLKGLLNMDDHITAKRVETVEAYINKS